MSQFQKYIFVFVISALIELAALGQNAFADHIDGLVGHWRLDENGGSTAIDSSGHGHDGVIVGGATFTSSDLPPVSGNVSALNFDGSSEIVIPDHPELRFPSGQPFTTSLWLKVTEPTTTRPVYHIISKRTGCSGSSGINYQLARDGGLYHFNVPRVNAGVDIQLNKLTHTAITYDGNTLRMYIDGAEVAIASGIALVSNTGTLKIASAGTCPITQNFHGIIDDVRIYNRALSGVEVAELAMLGTTSELYLANGDSANRGIYVVKGESVIRSWSNDPNVFAIAVADTVKTLPSNNTGTGREYTLEGIPTGVTYLHPGHPAFPNFLDGTTDGQFIYAMGHDDGYVYKFDQDWSNPVRLFFAAQSGGAKLGITYDPTNNSLWTSSFTFTSLIENWSMDGTLLSSFSTGHQLNAALALDYSDQTLWVRDRNASTAVFEQYSKSGDLLSVVDFGNLGNTLGAEFAFPVSAITPEANAGIDQTKNEGELVILDGSASVNATNYTWSQVAGPAVNLSSTTAVNPSFDAPFVPENTTLNFQLIVDDGQGNISDPDTVNITVVNVNNPPVADAGDDGTIKEGAVATLNGSNSFDPEGDAPLGYTWTQTTGPLVTLSSNTAVNPTFIAPLGVGSLITFSLVVDDGKEFSSPDEVVITVVENSQPIANAGADQTVNEGSLVYLDGTGSSDPDGGDTITFDWSEPVTLSDDTSPTPSFIAPFTGPGGGVLLFDLVVTDDHPGNPKSSSPDQVAINIRNINDPPRCDFARAVCPGSKIKNNDGCILWPPNHKLIEVTIDGVVDVDAQYNDVSIQITGITQDEPVNSGGDGDTSPDAIIQIGNTADSVLIRAERTGFGGAQENGRVYAVNFTASDGFESCTGSVSIGVPHDRKDIPVDDGQYIDSTQP